MVDGEGRWLNGVALDPYPCECSIVEDPSCVDDPADREGDGYGPDPGGDPTWRTFDPFTVYQPRACSTFGLGPYAEFVDRLRASFDASQHHAIEREVWTGGVIATNPAIADAGADLAGDPAGLPLALAQIEDAIGDTCRGGMIHMTRGAATMAARYNLLTIDAAASGRARMTATGTPVVIGSGYTGSGPDGAPAPAGASWIYATGPMLVRLGPVIIPADPPTIIDRRVNRVVVRAERSVVVEWDDCVHLAQLAGLDESTTPVIAPGSGSGS